MQAVHDTASKASASVASSMVRSGTSGIPPSSARSTPQRSQHVNGQHQVGHALSNIPLTRGTSNLTSASPNSQNTDIDRDAPWQSPGQGHSALDERLTKRAAMEHTDRLVRLVQAKHHAVLW
jgi:hypothetical protein